MKLTLQIHKNINWKNKIVWKILNPSNSEKSRDKVSGIWENINLKNQIVWKIINPSKEINDTNMTLLMDCWFKLKIGAFTLIVYISSKY